MRRSNALNREHEIAASPIIKLAASIVCKLRWRFTGKKALVQLSNGQYNESLSPKTSIFPSLFSLKFKMRELPLSMATCFVAHDYLCTQLKRDTWG